MMKWLGASLAVVLAACAALADWPQFAGPNSNDISPDKTPLAASWKEGQPREVWKVDLGPGYGGPCVEGGKVYVLDRKDDKQDILRCLDLKKGQPEWTYAYDAPGKVDHNGSRSTPAVDDKYIFTIGAFGHFNCISKETHKPVWTKNLLDDYGTKKPGWGVSQSPLLYKKTVIVAPQSPKAGLVAFDKDTGKEVWKSDSIGGMAYSSPFVTNFGGVEMVVMLSNDRVAGVNPDTGAILWTFNGWKCGIPITVPVAIGDGRFFITGGYGAGSCMFKLERGQSGFTATEVWKKKVCFDQIQIPILYKDHLYCNGNSNENHDGLMCLDLDGKELWKTGKEPNFDRGNLIMADGKIFMIDGNSGTLHLIQPDPSGYKELGKAKVLDGGEVWAPMAISDGLLIVRDQKQMKCLDVKAQ